MLFPSFFNAGPATYEIEQSLRFDGSGYLSRTPGSNGNLRTNTISVWIKQSAKNAPQSLFGQGRCGPRWSVSSNVGQILHNAGVGGTNNFLYSNGRYRDPSAWYHLVIIHDTTQATASDRVRIYINGTEITFSSASYPGQNADMNFNNTEVLTIGRGNTTDTEVWLGYMAEYQFIDGSAVEPDQFAEADNNGVWRPIAYSGSYGTQGYYLKFDPSATNGIGHDHSGNGNNFTASGFTTSGTGTDVMSDTPTNNWCTLNPLALSEGTRTLSDGNLQVDLSGNRSLAVGTFEIPATGKWYWEMTTNDANARRNLGVIQADSDLANRDNTRVAAWSANGEYKIESAAQTSGFSSYTDGDLVAVAIDADVDPPEIYFAKENTWQNSADPANGTNGLALTTGKRYLPEFDHGSSTSSSSGIFNFGQRAFAYTPPTGFKALNTSNLPAPTVKDGSEYFNTVLYTGNGSTQSITGVGFQPDWVWTKKRNGAQDHFLYDVVRGSTNGNFYELRSSSQSAEGVPSTASSGLTSLDSDGFSIGSDGSVNTNNDTYVAWNWDAGGSGSSNTDGSITSTVSANPSAGFSIVTWTGSQADGTVGHSLGVAPSLIIFKRRNATTSWPVYHSTISPSNFVALNETSSSSSSGTLFGSTPTAPTSTVFSVGNNGGTNYGTMVAYCFAEVEGYSKFGSYTGNGSTDGPFIFTGFTPAFILVKWYANVNTAESWQIYDTKRLTYNPNDAVLYPDSTTAEENPADRDVDILSNGFKWRAGGQQMNRSGASYIFAAFAEHPTGGSGVSPATAR